MHGHYLGEIVDDTRLAVRRNDRAQSAFKKWSILYLGA